MRSCLSSLFVAAALVGSAGAAWAQAGAGAAAPAPKAAATTPAATAPAQPGAPSPSGNAPSPSGTASSAAAAPQKTVTAKPGIASVETVRKTACAECGLVTGIREIKPRGNQTVIAAVGGPVAGQEIARQLREAQQVHEVSVRMDAGGTQVLRFANRPALDVGDKVRVRNGRVYLR